MNAEQLREMRFRTKADQFSEALADVIAFLFDDAKAQGLTPLHAQVGVETLLTLWVAMALAKHEEKEAERERLGRVE